MASGSTTTCTTAGEQHRRIFAVEEHEHSMEIVRSKLPGMDASRLKIVRDQIHCQIGNHLSDEIIYPIKRRFDEKCPMYTI